MTIRLVISDIDGTLVRNDKTLSEGVIAAAQRLAAGGIALSLISARPPSGMLWIAEKLGLTTPIGAFNGGTIVGADGKIVSADRLDPELAARTLELLDVDGVTPWLFADGNWYARETENRFVPRERRSTNVEPIVLQDFSALLAQVDKIVGVSEDYDALAALDGKVAAELGEQATVARSQPYYLDVTAPRANKGDGVSALSAALSIPLDAIAVLGDQRNDLPMFARAARSFAMGQAPEEVRAAATRVMASNDEDGVAQALDEILAG
jgi:Cof subfamily protein (haloacid dehalogenase superfamily)